MGLPFSVNVRTINRGNRDWLCRGCGCRPLNLLDKKGRERYREVPTGAACHIFDRQVAQGGSGGALAATREVRAEDGNIPGDKAKGNARGREGPDIAVDESW